MGLNSSHEHDLNRFYGLIGKLEKGLKGKRYFNQDYGKSYWPDGGVYFIFEESQNRKNDLNGMRVTRVGKSSSLSRRWNQHRGKAGGGGNHRISALRSHVGNAFISKDRLDVATWNEDDVPKSSVPSAEVLVERLVSEFIRNRMQLLWLSVPSASVRSYIEENSIAILSNETNPIDKPSIDWLGNHSPEVEIRLSGLWNVQHVRELYEPGFLDVLEKYVISTIG